MGFSLNILFLKSLFLITLIFSLSDRFSISLKLGWPEKGFKVTLKPSTKPIGLPLTCALIGRPFFPELSIQDNNSFHSYEAASV